MNFYLESYHFIPPKWRTKQIENMWDPGSKRYNYFQNEDVYFSPISLKWRGWRLLLGFVIPFRYPGYAPPFIVFISGPKLGVQHTSFPSLGKRKENSREHEYNVWRPKQWSGLYHFCTTLCHSHGHISLQRTTGEFSLWLDSHTSMAYQQRRGQWEGLILVTFWDQEQMSKTVHSNSELPSSRTTSRSSEVLLQKEAARKERNPKHYALAQKSQFSR